MKFADPYITDDGSQRAHVDLHELKTLWLNTGTLCNLACENCYIESTPSNDRLSYLTLEEALPYLNEIQQNGLGTQEIGITGGEPFMNPEILAIMQACLSRGFKLLVLTNAMRPMMRPRIQAGLLDLLKTYGKAMTIRVSVDHFKQTLHEEERGPDSWAPMIKGLRWLSRNKFQIDIAGRTRWGEGEDELRQGFAVLFQQQKICVDALDATQLTLFPEMNDHTHVPEITTDCWNILGVAANDMMCATSRMVVKHKDQEQPSVMACTLLAYDEQFNLGTTLKQAAKSVHLNHPHCAKFCVLGGGSCSG
ncbi:MAG: radical SAM protein [Pseudomonadales bacterium]|nr:radical SAM protein [Pseudomonadales bacterium]